MGDSGLGHQAGPSLPGVGEGVQQPHSPPQPETQRGLRTGGAGRTTAIWPSFQPTGSLAEVAQVWIKVLLTPSLCSHQGDDRECIKSGTWFLKTALLLATSPVPAPIQSRPCALRPATASPSPSLNTERHPWEECRRAPGTQHAGGSGDTPPTPRPLNPTHCRHNPSYTFPRPSASFPVLFITSPLLYHRHRPPPKPSPQPSPSTPASWPAAPSPWRMELLAALFSCFS